MKRIVNKNNYYDRMNSFLMRIKNVSDYIKVLSNILIPVILKTHSCSLLFSKQ
jgi:hypothetical protein